eukprot:TRINITY_DN20440_c0_g1_i1.p1 TRINITY_DN20440_c0_g1~~TRINITY_DN20440_c0_g1_i1.p1  ORF type:complete len:379 (+),score=161.81 TRINITY_DN20440_c0_g1_i1:161-1297(+)
MVGQMSVVQVAKRWGSEHLSAAISAAGVLLFALVYFKVCYVDYNHDAIRWMKHQTANDAVAGTPLPGDSPRLPAKYRMLNPLLMLLDYPVCRFLTFDLGIKDLSFVSANLISLIHPVVGVTAAYVLYRSAGSAGGTPGRYSRATDIEGGDITPGTEGALKQNQYLVKISAVLFQGRNTLDTLDGVVARAQRQGQKIATGLEGGFNGHTLDVITDMTGVTIFMISVWCTFYKLRAKVDKHSLPGLKQVVEKLLASGLTPVSVSRVLVFAGVAMICLTGAMWETTMLQMQKFFDDTANPEILALEQSPQVQLCYFLWAFTCSDTLFTYTIIAMLTGVAHDWFVFLSVYGWSWVLCLAAYSSIVTYTLASNPLLAAKAAAP